jgi:predicted enzyme related to lactoylglutathione lyase
MTMDHAVNWFEIPATDLTRARVFYETVFDFTMTELSLPNGLRMALFPVEPGGVGGALNAHPDFYLPGEQGSLVYLNGNPDLQTVLDRVPAAGGEVLMPKSRISEEHGYMALFRDTEGNRVALHSVS